MKTVVITGVSRGIGLATAKEFVKRDWKVTGTYNQAAIPPGVQCTLTPVQLDLASPASIKAAVKQITKSAHHIDVLINNAAMLFDGQDNTINLAKIRSTFEVDVFGTIDFTTQLLPSLSAKSHIINISSEFGAQSEPIESPTHTGYRMAKTALGMYTRMLAYQLRATGILVSAIDPGWVKTDMGRVGATDAAQPDREPAAVAREIYELAATAKESGHFWRSGHKRNW